MAIEIEKKYSLTADQALQISNKLQEAGAVFLREDFETNELYGGGKLDEKQAVLRIRKIGETTLLTYKERIENSSPVKRQIEYETKVEDREALEKIVLSLGFSKAIVYEKRRRTWRLNDAEIVLDELPFGLFMEIEADVTAIDSAEKLLGAENFQAEHETYPRLTKRHGTKIGEAHEARFL